MRGARLKMQSTSLWMGQTGTCRLGECLTGPKKANGPTTTAAAAQQQHLLRQQQMALKKRKKKNITAGRGKIHCILPLFCWYANVASRWAYYVAVAAAAAAAVATLDVAAVRQSLNAFFILLLIWVFYVLCGSCRCDF